MASSRVVLCVLHLKDSLVLPVSDESDDGALGHVEDPGWGLMGRKGSLEGTKYIPCPVHELAQSVTCSHPHPFSHVP